MNMKTSKAKKSFKEKISHRSTPRSMKWYSTTVDNDWGESITDNYRQLVMEGEFDQFFPKL